MTKKTRAALAAIDGAYMLGWRWVPFSGTPLTKICSCCENFVDKVTKVDGDLHPDFLCDECLEEAANAEV